MFMQLPLSFDRWKANVLPQDGDAKTLELFPRAGVAPHKNSPSVIWFRKIVAQKCKIGPPRFQASVASSFQPKQAAETDRCRDGLTRKAAPLPVKRTAEDIGILYHPVARMPVRNKLCGLRRGQ
jgi:hypothetical protein